METTECLENRGTWQKKQILDGHHHPIWWNWFSCILRVLRLFIAELKVTFPPILRMEKLKPVKAKVAFQGSFIMEGHVSTETGLPVLDSSFLVALSSTLPACPQVVRI